jgi:hypothetical protein
MLCTVSGKVCPVIDLKSAGLYAVLGGSTVANTGLSVIGGNVGLSPGTAISGFPVGEIKVGFDKYTNTQALQAKADLSAAMLQTFSFGSSALSLGGTVDVGGRTLFKGVYSATTTLGVLSGDLILDGQGDETATFIFIMVFRG